jgi:MFS family permease
MRPLVLLFVALFNSILGLSVLFPILAPLGRHLGLSEIQITSLSTGYAFMQFATAAYWGKRSEKRGRKPILLVGILGFSATFFAFAFIARVGLHGAIPAPIVFVLLLAARMVGGGFSSATLPTAQAYAADVSEREKRTSAMAVIGMAFGLGLIFGPGIGWAIAELTGDLLAPVYFSAGIALVNALFVALRLPEPARRASAQPPGDLSPIARRLWPLLAVSLTATLASVAMEQTVAFYFQDRLHLTKLETARVVGLSLVGYGLIVVLAQGVIVRRMKLAPASFVRIGLPIALSGFVLFVFAHTLLPLVCALLLQGLGQGLVLPGLTAAMSLAVSDDDQGSVAGLSSSAQSFGRMLGPIAGGALYELRMELPYLLSAVLLTVVLFAMLARRSFTAAAVDRST